MCGRFAITLPRFQHIESVLGADLGPVTPRYNIAPTQLIPVIRKLAEGFAMEEMRWGLVPSWSKTPTTAYATFNAKIETVADKPVYRTAFKHRRCLIPASGFYEWQTEEDGTKQPYYFTLKDDHEMAMAGLWEEWKGTDGSSLLSRAIIVGASNSLIEKVHDRMATIVPEDHFEDWLNPAENTDYLLAMLSTPYLADKMQAARVSRNVNSVRHQGPELVKPVS